MAGIKVPTIKLKGVTAPAASRKVQDRWPSLVSMQTRRVTGVTPKVIGSYPETPARLLSRSHEFKNLAGMTKSKGPK